MVIGKHGKALGLMEKLTPPWRGLGEYAKVTDGICCSDFNILTLLGNE